MAGGLNRRDTVASGRNQTAGWARGVDPATQAGILGAGIAAPSADNSQPWRFAWSGDELTLRIDPDRSGHVSDTRYVLSDLAAGACLENMLVRARALGYAADLDIFPRDDDALWVAHIRWRPDPDGAAEPLAGAIESRHTDRGFPWRGPVTAESRARLDAEAARIAGPRLWWPRTPGEKTTALRLIRHAEALRFRSPILHAELFSSIRFAAGWRAPCEEGLPPAALAVEPPLRPMFEVMRRPVVMATLNRLGAASMLGWRSAWLPIRLSPGLCLIVVPSAARPDVLAGGRVLQRVWLQATLEGLSVQPYAAAGVLGLGFVPVEPVFRQPLARLASALGELCGQGHALVFLRLGRARSPLRVRSGRRPVASFGVFEPPGA